MEWLPSGGLTEVEELRQVRVGPLFETKSDLAKMKPRVLKAG
jgi:hypothetical protein